MVNKPLIRPYFWGGYVRGGRLTSHDNWIRKARCKHSMNVIDSQGSTNTAYVEYRSLTNMNFLFKMKDETVWLLDT